MKQQELRIIEIDHRELEGSLLRIERAVESRDYEMMRLLADAYRQLIELLGDQSTTLSRLKKLAFGSPTEKTADVLGEASCEAPSQEEQQEESAEQPPADSDPRTPPEQDEQEPAAKKKGHGRNGAKAYTGGKTVQVRHESLKAEDACPVCVDGTIYRLSSPGVFVRLTGQTPLAATIYELEKLRCNLCGKVFTAGLPAGVASQKYDATAVAMIGTLKYGTGFPFHRLQRYLRNLGIPLAASTQWDIVASGASFMVPAYDELIRQAAQGEVIHNDDTWIKILEHMGKRARRRALQEAFDDGPTNKDGSPRKGLFTSGLVSMFDNRRAVLFFSGRQHAGENLNDVLQQRASGLAPPIQMCDALSRNPPGDWATIMANCLVHARRNFIDVHDRFPEQVRYVLESLKLVYKNEATARREGLSPEQRLALHQTKSRPVMDQLRAWLKKQFDDHLVEPNSALGKAISYMQKHWSKLTLFLRQAGAPLDNNVCETALKKAILHRKNALFFKSERGARVSDLYMSLIYTCEVNGANPLDYLTKLLQHAAHVAANPAHWMPWNYQMAASAMPATACS